MLRRDATRAPFREGLLPTGTEEADPDCLFPAVELDQWREGLFQLCWRQHGGSGLGVTLGDALELPLGDRTWLLERIEEQRTREAREIEKATKRR
jgi:hypothetical protein